MIGTRGLTLRRVTDAQFAVRQVLSDAQNPRTLTARIMREYEVSMADVMDVFDIAKDVITDSRRERETDYFVPTAAPRPKQTRGSGGDLQRSIAENREKALAAMRQIDDA